VFHIYIYIYIYIYDISRLRVNKEIQSNSPLPVYGGSESPRIGHEPEPSTSISRPHNLLPLRPQYVLSLSFSFFRVYSLQEFSTS